jgi:putative PIN family toxin of toxin-antitoxin system
MLPVISFRSWRIVLDTSVLISALRSARGTAAQILELIFLGEIVVCMDLKIACEYREVAMRSRHSVAIGLTTIEIQRLLTRLEERAESIVVVDRHRPLSTDPSDDMVLDVAINGKVDAIVTHNLKHMVVPGRRFGIPILTPGDFLKQLSKERANGNRNEEAG